ncbi:MAG: hypothetical protein WBP38_03795, partial [Hyphomicrobium sp.]
ADARPGIRPARARAVQPGRSRPEDDPIPNPEAKIPEATIALADRSLPPELPTGRVVSPG